MLIFPSLQFSSYSFDNLYLFFDILCTLSESACCLELWIGGWATGLSSYQHVKKSSIEESKASSCTIHLLQSSTACGGIFSCKDRSG